MLIILFLLVSFIFSPVVFTITLISIPFARLATRDMERNCRNRPQWGLPWYYEFDKADDWQSKLCRYLEVPPDDMPRIIARRTNRFLYLEAECHEELIGIGLNGTNWAEELSKESYPDFYRSI